MKNGQLKKLLATSVVTTFAAGSLFAANVDLANAQTPGDTPTNTTSTDNTPPREVWGIYKPSYTDNQGKEVRLLNATIKLTHKTTGKEYTLTVDANGETNDGKNYTLQMGEYSVELVSDGSAKIPEGYKLKTTSNALANGAPFGNPIKFELEKIEQPQPEPEPKVETSNFLPNLTVKTLNGKYLDVPGAVLSVTNNATGEVFEYTTIASRDNHRHIPRGEYTLHLVSVPEDSPVLKGKTYTKPEDKVITVSGISAYDGINLVETKQDTEKTPATGDKGQAGASTARSAGQKNKVSQSDPANKVKESDKKAKKQASSKLPATGFVSGASLGLGAILTAMGSALSFRRRK